jgi:hypothetical protein
MVVSDLVEQGVHPQISKLKQLAVQEATRGESTRGRAVS